MQKIEISNVQIQNKLHNYIMRSFIYYTPAKYNWVAEVKSEEMGRACSIWKRRGVCTGIVRKIRRKETTRSTCLAGYY
jgi:hypothetical protein